VIGSICVLAATFLGLSDLALQKMEKNLKKAIEEHAKKEEGPYIALEEIENDIKSSSLSFTYVVEEKQGVRSSMEDAHFFMEIDGDVLLGVFDGHGGREVAEFVCLFAQENFLTVFTETKQDIHQAFYLLIDRMQKEITARQDWDFIGSTLVLSFIDKKGHKIYTATVGDSEANIYRNIRDRIKSIPLSCVRDWSCPKEASRAAEALNKPEIAAAWIGALEPKRLRYPNPYFGINLSRSMGDVALTGTKEKPAVIHKPKITTAVLQPGDILALACDGLKDYVTEAEIIEVIQKSSKASMAKELVDFALLSRGSEDNVTVLVVYIQ
jgi:serine/threonine protein phosphatase PrpC